MNDIRLVQNNNINNDKSSMDNTYKIEESFSMYAENNLDGDISKLNNELYEDLNN
jgi:hypothetical protein